MSFSFVKKKDQNYDSMWSQLREFFKKKGRKNRGVC